MAGLCLMCCGSAVPPNFQKQIDPTVNTYGFMTEPDSPKDFRGGPTGGGMPMQLCLPTGGAAGMGTWIPDSKTKEDREPLPQQRSIIQMPSEILFSCLKFLCEFCSPLPLTKVWLIKSSPTPQKAVCLPAPAPVKIMLCLPCPPPLGVQGGEPNLPGQTAGYSNQQGEVAPSAFCVPVKCDSRSSKQQGNGKYLPPPEKRNCSPNCIHVSDIKGSRTCTWHNQVPCVAHCYDTPIRKE